MRRQFSRTAVPLLVCGVLAAAATGCAGQAASTPGHTGSVRALVTEAGTGWHQDYQPLASPADAVRRADLTVVGTLTGVTEGITIEYPDGLVTRRDTHYTTFQVRVDRVLSDKARSRRGAGPAGTVIHVVVPKSATVTTARLAQLNPQAEMVLVLADRTNWRPASGGKVIRPAAIPATAPLFVPYADGLWLQGPADRQMYGVQAETADLPPAWGSVRTVDQFAERLAAASVAQ